MNEILPKKFMGIIPSILDNDLYKFTMQQAVLDHYPDVPVSYEFINRNNTPFTPSMVATLQYQIRHMADLWLRPEEYEFLKTACPFLSRTYLEYLRGFKYNPNNVRVEYTADGQLKLSVHGTWAETILWEVPLLALISECHFLDQSVDLKDQIERAEEKGNVLRSMQAYFAEFGTRRRRSQQIQEVVFQQLHGYLSPQQTESRRNPYCVGTSNVYLAYKYNTKPIGTMAHEWIMGVSALEGLKRANRHALQKWSDTYRGSLGVALTDTFGTPAFFNDFDLYFAKLFDGVRHDSGDPVGFGETMIRHYDKLGIDPTLKTIVFSDGLNLEEVARIEKAFKGRIRTSYGIGTFFTNDVPGSKALNIVIKLRTCNGMQVVKLSDVITKATGDKDALRVAKWIFLNTPLDS